MLLFFLFFFSLLLTFFFLFECTIVFLLSFQMEEIIRNPAYQPFLALLKGARNGLVYGTKIRAPVSFFSSLYCLFLFLFFFSFLKETQNKSLILFELILIQQNNTKACFCHDLSLSRWHVRLDPIIIIIII